MTTLHLPAYFADGPHAGESMNIGGEPFTFYFPVPQDPWMQWVPLDNYVYEPPEVDTYTLIRPVLLYKYAGRR